MTEKLNGETAYEAGVDFYHRRINELQERFFKVDDPFTKVCLTEETELAQLRLAHLERRKEFGILE